MKIGVLCPSEIALRRFMPALIQMKQCSFVGIGVCTIDERFGRKEHSVSEKMVINNEYEKARIFVENYGGRIFDGYYSMIQSEEIDSVYIPLPPALHYKWAKLALENGKNVLVEKPATISLKDTKDLIKVAIQNNLALHENYMFMFHNQLNEIEKIIDSGEIGATRLCRITFGFPRKDASNFRYNKLLGGGALIDAGGYTIKYASRLLGNTIKIDCAKMNYINEFDVDLYGSATLSNDFGDTVQIAYGMDNDYKCELEVWGSVGTLKTGRILTAPAGYVPTVTIKKNNIEEVRALSSDDTFLKSIEYFVQCVNDTELRKRSFENIENQAYLIDQFKKKCEV